MRIAWMAWVLGSCLFGQGCGPLANVTRTLIIEPSQYCLPVNTVLEQARDCLLADSAWEQVAQAYRDYLTSPDYAQGFKEGFADYLHAGGTGAPPPVPPRRYWGIKCETPQGHQAIAYWFAGFRHGAAVAQQSGYRHLVTIPSSSVPVHPFQPVGGGPARVPSADPLLPTPRDVQPPPSPGKEPGTAERQTPSAASPGPEGGRAAGPQVVQPPPPEVAVIPGDAAGGG